MSIQLGEFASVIPLAEEYMHNMSVNTDEELASL
jgi:hypothetical protein